ncbi:TPA: ATP-binding cassette domain-containing protein [Staphylococcus aureus]
MGIKLDIEVVNMNNVTKKINGNTIIDNMNLTIPKNSITLIEGNNGSGKSVTLKLIANIINPTSGLITNNGVVSYAPDQFPNSIELTLNEYFKYLKKIYQLPSNSKIIDYMISNFQLQQFLNFKIKNCSKGTQQKVNIIQCLIKKSDIYILDEPFSGLDQDSIEFLIDFLNKLKSNATIVISSHEPDINKKIITHTFDLETKNFSNTISNQNLKQETIITVTDISNLDFNKAINSLNFNIRIKNLEKNKRVIIVPFSKTNVALLTLIQNNLTISKVICEEAKF